MNRVITNPFTGETLVVHHLPGKHGQKSHGRGKSKGGGSLSRDQASEMSLAEFKKNSKPAGKVKIHGMDKAETMRSVEVDGVEVVYSARSARAAHETVKSSSEVHPNLWNQNEKLVFTTREDAQAAAIAKQHGFKDFQSAASGGDGNIVVYGGRSMDGPTLAHESAHNLAQNTWGKGKPDVFDKKNNFTADRKVKLEGMQQRVSNAVTDYGKVSPEEDFAEFVTAYNQIMVQGQPKYREATAAKLRKRSKGLRAVKRLLGD